MSVTPSVEPSVHTPAQPSALPEHRGWTGGRIVSLVAGCFLGLASLGLLSAGGWATWETNTQRDAAGYVNASTHTLATAGHVVTSEEVGEISNQIPASILGNVRIRATATNPNAAVFIGIAPKAAVDGYLAGVDRKVVTGWFPFATHDVLGAGAAPKTTPIDARIWTAEVSGTGTQSLTWRPSAGNWTVVVMNQNGAAGVSAAADVGASIPDLAWFAVALFALGLLLLGAAVPLITVPLLRARH